MVLLLLFAVVASLPNAVAADDDARPARLLSVPQVMARLGISRATVYRLIGAGELPSFRLGRSRKISESSLVEFVRRVEARGDGDLS